MNIIQMGQPPTNINKIQQSIESILSKNDCRNPQFPEVKLVLKYLIRVAKIQQLCPNATSCLDLQNLIRGLLEKFMQVCLVRGGEGDHMISLTYFLQKFKMPFQLKSKFPTYQKDWEIEHELNKNKQRDLILGKFRNSELPVPPENLLKPTRTIFYWEPLNKAEGEDIVHLPVDIVKNPKQKNSLACKLVAIFNKNYGTALVCGLDSKNRVEGIFLTSEDIVTIKSNVMYVRNELIFPKPSKEQLFSIHFIKLQELIHEDKELLQGSYIVKIYIKMRSVGQCYFLKQKKQENQQPVYSISDGENKVIPEKMYNSMLAIYHLRKEEKELFKNNQMENIIEFEMEQQPLPTSKKYEVREKEQEQEKINYGIIPEKKYSYHSILIVGSGDKAKKKYEDFRANFEGQGEGFLCYEIFEKMNKQNMRKVYYMTHQRNSDDLLSFSLKLDKDRRCIILAKIKPQLSLLRNDFVQLAIESLQLRFNNYWKKNLRVLEKFEEAKQSKSYYFSFDDDEEAIFAFCLLEYSNIRTNFANQTKIEGAFMLQEHQIRQILKSTHKDM